MSGRAITFTPEAQDHIALLAGDANNIGPYLVCDTKVTARDGRVVLHDQDWSIAVSRDIPANHAVVVPLDDCAAHIPNSSLDHLRGRTVYLSRGHSSDTSVTSGDLLKVR